MTETEGNGVSLILGNDLRLEEQKLDNGESGSVDLTEAELGWLMFFTEPEKVNRFYCRADFLKESSINGSRSVVAVRRGVNDLIDKLEEIGLVRESMDEMEEDFVGMVVQVGGVSSDNDRNGERKWFSWKDPNFDGYRSSTAGKFTERFIEKPAIKLLRKPAKREAMVSGIKIKHDSKVWIREHLNRNDQPCWSSIGLVLDISERNDLEIGCGWCGKLGLVIDPKVKEPVDK